MTVTLRKAPREVRYFTRQMLDFKEHAVATYDGTEGTTDDLVPAVLVVCEDLEMMVLAPHIDRDLGLHAATTLTAALQPLHVTVMSDAHTTSQPNNPSTGQPWRPGEMQKACDTEGACTAGVLDDCLVFSTVWPDGRVRMATRIYTVTKGEGVGGSTISWTGTAEDTILDSLDDATAEPGGYMIDVLRAGWTGPRVEALNLITGLFGGILPPEELRARAVAAVVHHLHEADYMVLIAADTKDLVKHLPSEGVL